MAGMSKRNAKPAPRLPALDLLKGYEAAARLLSFTRAGAELHLTQSAVSRQIKELEDQLGVALFERRHRALALTEAGRELYPAAAQVLATMRAVTERLHALSAQKSLTVSTTPAFAALWLIPRLAAFARENPGVDVRIAAETRIQDLVREQVDVAVRYSTQTLAGPDAVRLFGEQMFPVCSPKHLAEAKAPLRDPADLRRHVLLHLDDPEGRWPWLSWRVWLEVVGAAGLRAAGNLSFTSYGDVIAAAIAGHGVALGRSPLVRDALRAGTLAAPFGARAESDRAYYLVVSRAAAQRPEVGRFADWVRREAAAAAGDAMPAPRAKKRAR
jgi:LysR family glycine cleavage system transcriptional activator